MLFFVFAMMAAAALLGASLLWVGFGVADRRGWRFTSVCREIVEGVALAPLGWAVFYAWGSGFGAVLFVLGLACVFVALVRALSGWFLRIYDKRRAARV